MDLVANAEVRAQMPRHVRGHVVWLVAAGALSIVAAAFLWQGRWQPGLAGSWLSAWP